MSKRKDVHQAVVALVQSACPAAKVLGLDHDGAKPIAIPPEGLIIVRRGTMSEIAADLSPLTYHYQHDLPVEIAFHDGAEDADERVDAAMSAIGAIVLSNRRLGGLVDWLDAQAPDVDDIVTRGGQTATGALLGLSATYTSPSPLT